MNSSHFFSKQNKGLLWVFAEAASMSLVYVISKTLLSDLSLPVFGFLWFGFGLIWHIPLIIFNKNMSSNFKSNIGFWGFLAWIGFIEIVSTSMWFLAINNTENPSVVSFMTNIGPVYAAILGLVFLRERFGLLEAIGAVLTLLGAFVIGFVPGIAWWQFVSGGAGIILISSFIYAMGTVWLKSRIVAYHPAIISLTRCFMLFAFSSALLLVSGEIIVLHPHLILILLIGSLLGPMVSTVAGYHALRLMKAGTYTMLNSSRSLLVVFTSWIFLHNLPLLHQLLGGLLTIAGVVLVGRARVKQNKAQMPQR